MLVEMFIVQVSVVLRRTVGALECSLADTIVSLTKVIGTVRVSVS